MTTLPEKDLFRVDEVAKYFQVHRVTVYRWIESGSLDAVRLAGKILRIKKAAIKEFQRENVD